MLWKKMREAAVSVFPVAAIVFFLNLTPLIHLTATEMLVFLGCALCLILGIGLFSMGTDLAMTPMGEHVGAGLVTSAGLPLLLAVCFAMGVLITVAEPDLSVLASQVKEAGINGTLLIVTVGVGVGLFLVAAILKIAFRRSLSAMLMFFYMLLFALVSLVVINGNSDFIALAFDSGGVTTGPITVPFIMALGVGIAATLGGKDAGEASFGLVAMCSIGPILAVMMLGISSCGEIGYRLPDYSVEAQLGAALGKTVLSTIKDVALALALIVLFFLLLQFTCLHLPRKRLFHIAVGILFTFVGLVVFLAAVHVGFMPVGYKLGCQMAEKPALLVACSFLLGMVVVLAEPAVHVLNRQVEEITEGTVSRRAMMTALSVGVGCSLGLSMLRIIWDFNILYYLIPGYFISLGLSFFVPGIYTAIAFDSGGVASGPLTSSFILPFAIGACVVLQGEGRVMADAFGIVAMVAMTPLITIQFLGFRALLSRHLREKNAMKRILAADDEQIIDFT